MNISELKTENSTATVKVLITSDEVEAEKTHAIAELATQVTVKGFRQGKAPLSIAEQHLNPERVTDHVLQHLLSNAVSQALSEYKYKLLGRPVLNKIEKSKDGGWELDLSFPLFPKVELGSYKKYAKVAKPKTKKTEKPEDKNSPTENPLDAIYDSLLKNAKVTIPQSVIDEEVNYSLDRLASQAKALNLTLEAYLKAVNRSLDQIKSEYSKSAEESLRLDLILLEIAKEENITATDKEVEEFATQAGANQNQYARIKSIIERRKTLELLQTL